MYFLQIMEILKNREKKYIFNEIFYAFSRNGSIICNTIYYSLF